MNKKILTLCIVTAPLVFLTACDSGTTINVIENKETISKEVGTGSLIDIGGNLYYDSYTNIVYFWNGVAGGRSSTTPSAYFAPNGFPYTYNPKTNTLEENDYENINKKTGE